MLRPSNNDSPAFPFTPFRDRTASISRSAVVHSPSSPGALHVFQNSSATPLLLSPTVASPVRPPTTTRVVHYYQRWSVMEDTLLNDAVMETSGGVAPFRWKRISLDYFKGLRTDIQCRSRWTRAVDPKLKLGHWSDYEDNLIRTLRQDQGMHFRDITKQLPGRRVETIRDRYQQNLDPALCKDQWNNTEKEKLFQLVSRMGHKWIVIATHFPGRSEASCKNTWFNALQSQERRKKRRAFALQKQGAELLLVDHDWLNCDDERAAAEKKAKKTRAVMNSQALELP